MRTLIVTPAPATRGNARRCWYHPFALALLLIAAISGAPGAVVLAAEPGDSLEVAGTDGAGARLRDAPSLDGAILLVVPEGATVALLGASRQADGLEWAPVSYRQASGWIAASYLRSPGAVAAQAAGAPAVERAPRAGGLAVGGQAVVTGTGGAGLRIRADASLDAPVVGYAPLGATVAVIARPRGEWYGIRYGQIEGWSSGRFLTAAGTGTVSPPTSSAPTPSAPVAASVTGAALAVAALKYLGVPYVWGGATPAGWDCSGFVYYIVRQVTGQTLPRTTQAQWGVGTPIAREAIQTGDLVFFQNTYKAGITHVGFALGDGRFVHASAPGVGTIISSLSDPYYVAHYAGARRV